MNQQKVVAMYPFWIDLSATALVEIVALLAAGASVFTTLVFSRV